MKKLWLLFFTLNVLISFGQIRFDPYGPYDFDEEESGFVYLRNFNYPTIKADKLLKTLKGKVKSIREMEYEIPNPSVGEAEELTSSQNLLRKFDKKGRLIEEISHDSDGNVSLKNAFKYKSNKSLIIMQSYNEKGNLIEENIYQYDNKGNLLKYFPKDVPTHENLLIYDTKNNRIDVLWQGTEEKRLLQKDVFKYDKKGRLIKQSSYLFQGGLVDTSMLEMDGSEEEMLQSRYDYKGIPSANLDYQYDNKGDLVVLEYSNYYGTKFSINIQYDPKKNWKKEVVYTMNEQGKKEQTSSVVYLYKSTKIPKEVREDSTLITYDYQYDSKGNWIEKVEKIDGEISQIIKREIEYY